MGTYLGIVQRRHSGLFYDVCYEWDERESVHTGSKREAAKVRVAKPINFKYPWLILKPSVVGVKTARAIREGIICEYTAQEAVGILTSPPLNLGKDRLKEILEEEDYKTYIGGEKKKPASSTVAKKSSETKPPVVIASTDEKKKEEKPASTEKLYETKEPKKDESKIGSTEKPAAKTASKIVERATATGKTKSSTTTNKTGK